MPDGGSFAQAIFNYALTVEEYVFALSEKKKLPENCKRPRKIAKKPEKVRETMQLISFFIHAF